MRVYECGRCGFRLDRDVNAATCVLVRAFGDEARWGGATPPIWPAHPHHMWWGT